MKRTVLLSLGAALVVCTVGFVLWPLYPPAPATAQIQAVEEGQETFARRLALALAYERHRQLDSARELFEEAALSEQADIAAAARDGLERVLAAQQAPWLAIQAAVRAFVYRLGEILLSLIIVAAVIVLVWLLISLRRRRSGCLILPFEDFTDDGRGEGLHLMVNQWIQQAQQVHRQGQDTVRCSSERLEFATFGTLSDGPLMPMGKLTDTDVLSVSGTDLPLGTIALAIQQWAGTRTCEHVLSGSVHQDADGVLIHAVLRDVTPEGKPYASPLTIDARAQPDDPMTVPAEELAFRVLFAVCHPEVGAKTWRSLQLLTNALQNIQRYGADTLDMAVLEQAAASLAQALILDPGYTSAHYLLGTVYSNLGRWKEAREAFRQVTDAGGRLLVEATYGLGLAFYHEAQGWAYDAAMSQFEAVVTMLAESPRQGEDRALLLALTHCGLAATHAQRLGSHRVDGRCKDADDLLAKVKAHCEHAVSLAGDHAEVTAAASNALGVAYLNAGFVDEAIAELSTAVRADPAYPIAYVNLARAYRRTDPERCIDLLERAVRLRPTYEYAHLRLGRAYAALGDTVREKEEYRRAPGIADAHNHLGERLAAEGDYEGALAEFRTAVALSRRHSRAWRNLAWWTLERPQPDERALRDATQWARRALAIDCGTAHEWRSRDVLGWALFHQGRLADAEPELIRSTEADDGHERIQNRYHLARVYQRLGDRDRAVQTLASALALHEKGHWREKAVSLMRELHGQEASGSA